MNEQQFYMDRIMKVRSALIDHADWLSGFEDWNSLSVLEQQVEAAAELASEFNDLAQELEDIVGEMGGAFEETIPEPGYEEEARPLYGPAALHSIVDRLDVIEDRLDVIERRIGIRF